MCAEWHRLFMILRFELITNRDDRLDVLVASQPKLLSNTANMHVNGSGFAKSLISPTDVEQLVSRKDPTWVLDEKSQQSELFKGELRLAAVDSNLIAIEINVQSTIVENSLSALISLVSEHRPDLYG